MEAWSCVSENKGFVSDESVGREKNSLLGWELKAPSSSGNNFVLTNVEEIEKQVFGEFGLPETIREHWDVSSSVTVSNSNAGVLTNKRLYTTITPSSVSVYSGGEPISRPSSSVVTESTNRDFSLIDLKLGKLSDYKDSLNFRSSKIRPIGSSVGSSPTPAKRGRASLSCQGAFCQVLGCKKDLSFSKDYHKRHKVCEIHSKTAKVIVNGIEQRFCQQCSRFHLLGEFDDGKRSCRKRLAGHNERRRKPQMGNHVGRAGRLFHSYLDSTGSRLPGSMLTTSSVISQDPADLMYPFKHNSNDWNGHNNHKEGGSFCCPQSEIIITNRYHNLKSIYSHSLDKNIPPFRVNKANSSSGMGDLSEITTQNIHENFFVSKSASAALSLLSSQSRNSSSHSSGTLVHQPLINGLSNKFIGPTGLFSLQEGNNSINDSVNYDDGMFQGSTYNNSKGEICGEDVGTINLIQLSTQFQRVEHERRYTKINQDNEVIRGMKIT